MSYKITITNTSGSITARIMKTKTAGAIGSEEDKITVTNGSKTYSLKDTDNYLYYFQISSTITSGNGKAFDYYKCYINGSSTKTIIDYTPCGTAAAEIEGNTSFTVVTKNAPVDITVKTGNSSRGYVGFNSPTYTSEAYSASQKIEYGGSATFRALGKTGFEFSKWDDNNTDNPRTVSNITSAKTYTASFDTKYCTVSFDGNGGTVTSSKTMPTKVIEGNTLSTSAYKCTWSNTKSDNNHKITFTINNNETYTTQNTVDGSSVTTHYLSGWKNTTSGATYTTSDSIIVTSDFTLQAIKGSNTPTVTGGHLSELPTISRPGYKWVNSSWYLANGTRVTTSTKFSEDTTVNATLNPNKYTVKFSLRKNSGEAWVDSSNDSFTKTFGESFTLPSTKVTRYGYTFKGWCNKQDIIESHGTESIKYSYGGQFDDQIYIANNYSGDVTLYPWFEPINNTIKYKYYDNAHNLYEETGYYNIETTANSTPYKKGAPDKPFVSGNNDYTFLGWTNTIPEGNGSGGETWKWGDNENKGKGLFLNPEEVKDCKVSLEPVDNPLTIYTNSKTIWGLEDIYYGLWTKTGKYIRTKDGWKKISTAYIKTSDGWKAITDVYVCTDIDSSGDRIWKHEV